MRYFDIQVNGFGGVDFNQDDLTLEDLNFACRRLQCEGVEGILATIITEAPEKMIARLKRLVELRECDPLAKSVIAGFHVEGPFLSPKEGFRGAHPVDAICLADETLAARLLEAGAGFVRIFTLAPEQDPGAQVTRFLHDEGTVVSAGHTDATLDELRGGIDAGLSMMTHLGNGCPRLLDRHDNIIQRALFLRDYLWLSFIPDGVHIPLPVLRNYLDLAGDKALLTSDAMAAAGLGPGVYQIGRWSVEVKENLAAWAPDGSHLLGSARSLKHSVAGLANHLDLSPTQIETLTWFKPRQSIGLVD